MRMIIITRVRHERIPRMMDSAVMQMTDPMMQRRHDYLIRITRDDTIKQPFRQGWWKNHS